MTFAEHSRSRESSRRRAQLGERAARRALYGFATRSKAVVLAVDIPAVALILMCAIPSGAVGLILRASMNGKFPKAPNDS